MMNKIEDSNPIKHFKLLSHIIFWVCIWILFTVLESNIQNFFRVLGKEFVNVLFYVILIYTNLYYLIPRYLTEKKFGIYVFWLIFMVVVVTSAKIVVLYIIMLDSPNAQEQLLQNQEWLFILNFILVGASTIFGIIKDWVTHQRVRKELEKQTMQSELNFLRSQVNPHFLFNTLNSLYALTLKKSEKAPETVLKLSEIMRYMLYECNEKQVPLEKEITYVRNYLDLEKLRHGEGVNIHFDVENDVEGKNIAPLLLIPFVENAFKHGIKNQIRDGYVYMNLKINENVLFFDITNSKPPLKQMVPYSDKKSGGIGLVNVQRRLNLIYPDKYKLKINNTKEFYKVSLKLVLDQSASKI